MEGGDRLDAYPVLLVHGIDDTGRRFAHLKAYLMARGLPRVCAMDIIPADASISIQSMAAQVQQAALAVEQTASSGKIDIVAYSMGTLAVRYFIQRLGGKNQVRRFISIAGPHHGTLAAWLRQNEGCRQMRPGSAFLKEINSDRQPWGEVAVYSFWLLLDLMIFPSITSILPGARNRAFLVAAHPLTVSDKRVMQAVWQALTAP